MFLVFTCPFAAQSGRRAQFSKSSFRPQAEKEKIEAIEEAIDEKLTRAEQLKNSADSIKNCRKSCEGLRIDQKASCMLKCACGEIKSSDKPLKLFDPEEFP